MDKMCIALQSQVDQTEAEMNEISAAACSILLMQIEKGEVEFSEPALGVIKRALWYMGTKSVLLIEGRKEEGEQ